MFTDHSLKAGVESDEKRGFLRHGKNSLLDHRTFDVIVLDDDVLFEDLYRVQFVGTLSLGQHHLDDDVKVIWSCFVC